MSATPAQPPFGQPPFDEPSPQLQRSAQAAAAALGRALTATQTRIVFAESCTAGLVSALLGQVPGISEWHCGSAVTYREATKITWLGVAPDDLVAFTAVSEPVACQMALGVLQQTPEAEISLSITGHFGPGAPDGFDGLAFVAVALRVKEQFTLLRCDRLQLAGETRVARQWEAAARVLEIGSEILRDAAGNDVPASM